MIMEQNGGRSGCGAIEQENWKLLLIGANVFFDVFVFSLNHFTE